MVVRAMANFGLSDLRLASPRHAWPDPAAAAAASGALERSDMRVIVHANLASATKDLQTVHALTARPRALTREALDPAGSAERLRGAAARGERTGTGLRPGERRAGQRRGGSGRGRRVHPCRQFPVAEPCDVGTSDGIRMVPQRSVGQCSCSAAHGAAGFAGESGLLSRPAARDARGDGVLVPAGEGTAHGGERPGDLHPQSAQRAGIAHTARNPELLSAAVEGSGLTVSRRRVWCALRTIPGKRARWRIFWRPGPGGPGSA